MERSGHRGPIDSGTREFERFVVASGSDEQEELLRPAAPPSDETLVAYAKGALSREQAEMVGRAILRSTEVLARLSALEVAMGESFEDEDVEVDESNWEEDGVLGNQVFCFSPKLLSSLVPQPRTGEPLALAARSDRPEAIESETFVERDLQVVLWITSDRHLVANVSRRNVPVEGAVVSVGGYPSLAGDLAQLRGRTDATGDVLLGPIQALPPVIDGYYLVVVRLPAIPRDRVDGGDHSR